MSRRSGRRAARRYIRNMPPIGRELLHDYATMPGCCLDTPEEIATMRQLTHDAVIDLTGPDRLSGVTWRQWSGTDALKVLHEHFAADANADHVAQYDAFLREHGEQALLIVAYVEVAPGTAEARGRTVHPTIP